MANKYLKFTYWNDCDLAGVVFTNGFQYWFFLDALVTEPEEEIFEDVEKDGEENPVITFRRAVKRYRIVTPLIPEYMVDAINRMKLHDNIQITFTNTEVLTLTKDAVTTETEYFDESTCFAKVVIKFDVDETVIKTNCCAPILSSCLEAEDCNVVGVLYAPHFLTWTDILAAYPAATENDLFLLLAPYGINQGYGTNNVSLLTAKGVTDDAVWQTNQCFTNPTGKMILTADGEYWYNDGTYWYQVFAINTLASYAVIPPPAYNWLTVAVGRSLPGTFVQLQYQPFGGGPWVDIGSAVTSDDYMTMGVQAYHSLSGSFYLRVKCYNYNCDYEEFAEPSDVIIFP